jgi:hypothetical protein
MRRVGESEPPNTTRRAPLLTPDKRCIIECGQCPNHNIQRNSPAGRSLNRSKDVLRSVCEDFDTRQVEDRPQQLELPASIVNDPRCLERFVTTWRHT